MDENELSPEQRATVEGLVAEFEQHVTRVTIDPQAAFPQLHQVAPTVTRPLPDGTHEESLTIDVSGIVEALRGLPDGAGTAAFVAAYNAAHPNVRGPAI